jgi:hypothetical protein
MSDKLITIEETITGEWWWIAALFGRLQQDEPLFKRVDGIGVTDRSRDGLTEIHRNANGTTLGTVRYGGNDGKTTIHIEATPTYGESLRATLIQVSSIAETAHNLHRAARKTTPEGAIEHYYRRKAAGSKITIGQISAQTGISEKTLRNVKVEYDRAGKWGSKPKRTK